MKDKRMIDAVETVALIREGEMPENSDFTEGFNAGLAYAIETIDRQPTGCADIIRIEFSPEQFGEALTEAVERILEEEKILMEGKGTK